MRACGVRGMFSELGSRDCESSARTVCDVVEELHAEHGVHEEEEEHQRADRSYGTRVRVRVCTCLQVYARAYV